MLNLQCLFKKCVIKRQTKNKKNVHLTYNKSRHALIYTCIKKYCKQLQCNMENN